METKPDIKQALRVFSIITTKGKATDNAHRFNGITARSDFDGYTVSLSNDMATLTIFFHNRFSFEYTNNKERDLFLEKLRVIAANG